MVLSSNKKPKVQVGFYFDKLLKPIIAQVSKFSFRLCKRGEKKDLIVLKNKNNFRFT